MALAPFQPLTNDPQGQAASLRALYRKLKEVEGIKPLNAAAADSDVINKVNELLAWAKGITRDK